MSENQKKIWITGASSGIGKAVAEKFAAEGWKVAVSARRKELLQELATNENIVSFPLDVTEQNQINTVFKNIINEFGNLDLCLFSSGTYEPKDEQNIDSDKIKNPVTPESFPGNFRTFSSRMVKEDLSKEIALL